MSDDVDLMVDDGGRLLLAELVDVGPRYAAGDFVTYFSAGIDEGRPDDLGQVRVTRMFGRELVELEHRQR